MNDNDFCGMLEGAVSDEESAGTDYGRLAESARRQGMRNEADTIEMIQEQEKSHEDKLDRLYRRECR